MFQIVQGCKKNKYIYIYFSPLFFNFFSSCVETVSEYIFFYTRHCTDTQAAVSVSDTCPTQTHWAFFRVHASQLRSTLHPLVTLGAQLKLSAFDQDPVLFRLINNVKEASGTNQVPLQQVSKKLYNQPSFSLQENKVYHF